MKVFLCLCSLLAVANAGILSLGHSHGGHGGYSHGGHGTGNTGGGHAQVYKVITQSRGSHGGGYGHGGGHGHGHGHGGGHGSGPVHVVRLIHQESGPSIAAPQVIRVIHEQGAVGYHGQVDYSHDHGQASPHVIHVVHSQASGSSASSGSAELSQPIAAPATSKVIRVIHEHTSASSHASAAPAYASLPALAPAPAFLPEPAPISHPSQSYLPPVNSAQASLPIHTPAQSYGPPH